MDEIAEHTLELDDQPVFWRATEPPAWDGGSPVVYVHGVPTSSDEWPAFLARTGGVAPDLHGFGRTGKRGDGAYTLEEYDAFFERWLALALPGVDRIRLVVHDWGAVGLLWAMRFPERVERLVIIDAVPLLPGHVWHGLARAYRMPVVGELVMGWTTRWTLRRASRRWNATPGPMPEAWIAGVLAHFDEGTQRAILRLHRSTTPERLAAAGDRLGELRCPALVVWGDDDPLVPPRLADAYAAALGGPVTVRRVADAGHWPWLDRPELIDEIAAFLAGAAPAER